jgi:hypothetical protein
MTTISTLLVPNEPENLGGPFVTETVDAVEVLAERDKVVLVEFICPVDGADWVQTHELMFCQRQHDPSVVKVLRKATEEERRIYRVPLWIQGEEVPECCGHHMFFVGQIDDNNICTERPRDAKMWWHDGASFYVFTCQHCLEVKAVGQQF